jgi:hypothetical protein
LQQLLLLLGDEELLVLSFSKRGLLSWLQEKGLLLLLLRADESVHDRLGLWLGLLRRKEIKQV